METPDCMIIAIDGPAGSGKSTLARGLARELGLEWLNSGSTYRAIALKALMDGIDPSDETATTELVQKIDINLKSCGSDENDARVLLDGKDVTVEIRTNDVSVAASTISRHPEVREAMVELQRDIAERSCREGSKGIIVEGRDIGTVVFPDADVKIYLEASLRERAQRRMSDFAPSRASLLQVKAEILSRDIRDETRRVSPLKPAPDAIRIDNTDWPVEKTLEYTLGIIREKLSMTG